MQLGQFLDTFTQYFNGTVDPQHGEKPYGETMVIDQRYQERLAEGMFRCYICHDMVAGFGFQALNVFHPTEQPGPRLYHHTDMPEAAALKKKVETEWLPQMQKMLGLKKMDLPLLWDLDFLIGPKSASGADTYVLCEVNTQAVSPFPASALVPVASAAATQAKIGVGVRLSRTK